MTHERAEKVDIFMAFYPADYLADTMDLTTEEHGAYVLLLFALWRNQGWIDNDPVRLASTAKVAPKRWPAIWKALARFFEVQDGKIAQRRLLREIENAQSRKVAARHNGRLGGLAKAARVARNPVDVGQASATTKTLANDLANPASSPSPSQDSPPPARDPSAAGPGPHGPSGPWLTQTFGRVRSELWPSVMEWAGAPASPEKASNMASSIPPEAIPDVAATMRVMLMRAKAGEHRRSADIAKSPGFAFACWCQEFHELREELRGVAPEAPPLNGTPRRQRDQRVGYAEPPPPGTAYPSGKVQLR